MTRPSSARHQADTVVLPPQLFGSVAYYTMMARYPSAVIDTSLRYDKRFKSVHRSSIADTAGVRTLTVPVSRPEGGFLSGKLSWDDISVSDHGRWWDVHIHALETAYARTPYFEFYIDRFRPLFSPEQKTITELVLEADAIIRRTLGIDIAVTTDIHPDSVADDFRHTDFAQLQAPCPYWQLRADTLGFLPSLSILDLIFNIGPEAPLLIFNGKRPDFANIEATS